MLRIGVIGIGNFLFYFGDKVDFYVDGDTITNNQPSTIIGLDEHANIIVFRRGAVDIDRLFTK